MTAPWPEGSATVPPTHDQMFTYLGELDAWITDSRASLDRIDHQIQHLDQGPQDMAMTLAMWQAIKDRYTDLLNVWDSGRVIETDLKKLAIMIWANLNDMLTAGTTLTNAGGLSVSLPEACRMLEALLSQLTTRYQLADVPTETSTRIAALLAQVERVQDQVKLDPPEVRVLTQKQADSLSASVQDLVEKMNRGGDVGGILGPVEIRAAQLERDLIVSHAQRGMLAQRITEATQHRADLIAHEKIVRTLVAKVQASVDPAPKYAVPQVEALGEVPTSSEELEIYIQKLKQVAQGFDTVSRANNEALAKKQTLLDRFTALEAEASTSGTSQLRASLGTQIRTLLDTSPTPLSVLEPLIASYEAAEGPS